MRICKRNYATFLQLSLMIEFTWTYFLLFFSFYIPSHPHSRCRARTLKKDNRGEVSYFLWLPLLLQVRRVDVGEQWLDRGTDCLTAVTCTRVCVQVTRTNSSDRDEERREKGWTNCKRVSLISSPSSRSIASRYFVHLRASVCLLRWLEGQLAATDTNERCTYYFFLLLLCVIARLINTHQLRLAVFPLYRCCFYLSKAWRTACLCVRVFNVDSEVCLDQRAWFIYFFL